MRATASHFVRKIPLLKLTSALGGATLVVAACGGADGGPGFGSSGNGSSGANASGGLFGNGDGGGSDGQACVNLCLQQKACANGGTTSLSGTVYDPAGKVPLYNVIVYVPNAPVAPIRHGASCDRCGDVSGNPLVSAITDTAGKFRLTNVPVGSNVPVVIQVGKWRRQLTVKVPECVDTPLAATDTRLPKNQSEGDIPLIALTTGGADALECFLRKVGLDDAEFSNAGGSGRVHFYAGSPQGGGFGGGGRQATSAFDATHGGQPFGDAQTTLWSDVHNLQKYDMVLLSCEGQTYPETKPQSALDALFKYTTMGGRVFASHWHRYWLDPQADGNGPMMGTTQFTNLGVWNDDDNFPDPINATVDTSFPKGQAMQAWLGNVNALTGGLLPIQSSKKNLESVNKTNAQQWITYASPAAVEYMSFNVPEGVPDDQKCGRVVYSDLHVSSGAGDQPGPPWPGGCHTTDLSPQEKALEFMLFDLSSCIQSDTQPPAPPPAVR